MNRVMTIATATVACALLAGCAAGEPGPDPVGEASTPIGYGTNECGQYDPTFLCDQRLWVHEGLRSIALPYCANDELDPLDARGNPNPPLPYKRLIIGQHGRGSGAYQYVDNLSDATWEAIKAGIVTGGETLVVAPQFIQPQYACEHGVPSEDLDDLFVWSQGGPTYDWATGGLSSKAGEPIERSSLALLEQLLDLAISRMPDLEEIIFAGQSAGGQFVQRFAALNDYPFDPDLTVRYVPANPWAVLYPTGDRPEVGGSGFGAPIPGVYPDREVCSSMAYMCIGYNDYSVGLDAIPPGHWAGEQLPLDQVTATYAQREVTYLIGEGDIAHAEQCGCATQLQGQHRRDRSESLSRYMRDVVGAVHHEVLRVPDYGHGGGIFKQPCGYAAIFGDHSLCVQTQDHIVGAGITGAVVATAFGNVDDDPAEELAIVEQVGFTVRVRVLDDLEHAYAELFAPSDQWGFLERGQDVAFGDVNGDGRDELAVGRSSNGGDTWLIYRRFNNGSWALLDSGGAEWESPRTANRVAFGDTDGDGWEELGVTRSATDGARWYVYSHVQGQILPPEPMELTRSWGSEWPAGVRPTDLVFGDFDGDGNDELAVSHDATSGSRLTVYDFAGWLLFNRAIGSGWAAGNVVRHLAAGDVDRDDSAELLVGRDVVGNYSRWFLLDDAATDYDVWIQGGFDSQEEWTGATLTGMSLGYLDMSSVYQTLALTAQTPGGSLVELVTFDDDSNGDPVVADYARPDLGNLATLASVAVADVDGLGGGEIVIGVGNPQDVGYGLRVLPAP